MTRITRMKALPLVLVIALAPDSAKSAPGTGLHVVPRIGSTVDIDRRQRYSSSPAEVAGSSQVDVCSSPTRRV